MTKISCIYLPQTPSTKRSLQGQRRLRAYLRPGMHSIWKRSDCWVRGLWFLLLPAQLPEESARGHSSAKVCLLISGSSAMHMRCACTLSSASPFVPSCTDKNAIPNCGKVSFSRNYICQRFLREYHKCHSVKKLKKVKQMKIRLLILKQFPVVDIIKELIRTLEQENINEYR